MSEMSSDAWYAESGPENDVVLSTRIRLARDLANFPFPQKFKEDDAQRVKTLVFDSFSHCQNPDNYQVVLTSDLNELGRKILCERGVIDVNTPVSSGSGVVIRTDGCVSCVVNDIDHVRIAAFVPGLNAEKAFKQCRAVDDELQNSVQFAASFELGFLTSAFADCGSGMKVSCRLHLPSLSFADKIPAVCKELDEKGVVIKDCFGAGVEKNSSLGSFYQISSKNSGNGNEFDQIANVVSAASYIAKYERRMRNELLEKQPTVIRDRIYRSYAKIRFTFLEPLREAFEVVSDIKWGKNLGLLEGIEDNELCALLYRIQKGHLQFVLDTKKFNFPKDLSDDSVLKEEHLRALILQEAFENLKIIA